VAIVTIDGESAEIDVNKLGLHEAMALQKATGFRPKELGEKLAAGDAVAMGAFIWLWLRFRMGKVDVTWEDIESGAYPVDMASIRVDLGEDAGGEAQDPPVAATAMTSS
jgi:hypothetical protein